MKEQTTTIKRGPDTSFLDARLTEYVTPDGKAIPVLISLRLVSVGPYEPWPVDVERFVDVSGIRAGANDHGRWSRDLAQVIVHISNGAVRWISGDEIECDPGASVIAISQLTDRAQNYRVHCGSLDLIEAGIVTDTRMGARFSMTQPELILVATRSATEEDARAAYEMLSAEIEAAVAVAAMRRGEVEAVVTEWVRLREHIQTVAARLSDGEDDPGLSEEAYVALCAEVGVNRIEDVGSYGVKFGEFYPPEYRPEECGSVMCARLRFKRIEAEREREQKKQSEIAAERSAEDRRQAIAEGRVCYVCGSTVGLLAGSLGTLCMDHYDDEESEL